jgi:hypothetical protein
MAYFVIEFIATINGSHIERGKIGSMSSDTDYHPNTVKNTIENHFRTINPNTKSVAVVLNKVLRKFQKNNIMKKLKHLFA